ncbi:MAG: rubrerythrin family protein [Bacteroidota bacterium]|nr:rubrerythrin family protein [Bacteroidota bacterium]
MKKSVYSGLIAHLQSVVFLLPPAIFLFLAVMAFGCHKKEEAQPAKPVVTLENLQTAYLREARLAHTYNLFADKLGKAGDKNVSRLYRAAARAEEIHAAGHAALLKKNGIEPKPYEPGQVVVGTVQQTFRMALSEEGIEAESMYPNLARTAALENFPEAAEQFNHAKNAVAQEGALFKDALDRDGSIPTVPYFICPGCGFIMTSDKTMECPECHCPKLKFEKI